MNADDFNVCLRQQVQPSLRPGLTFQFHLERGCIFVPDNPHSTLLEQTLTRTWGKTLSEDAIELLCTRSNDVTLCQEPRVEDGRDVFRFTPRQQDALISAM